MMSKWMFNYSEKHFKMERWHNVLASIAWSLAWKERVRRFYEID